MDREELRSMRRRARTEGWTTAARNIWREGGSTSGRGVDEEMVEMEEGLKEEDREGITTEGTRYETVVNWEVFDEEIDEGRTSTPQRK